MAVKVIGRDPAAVKKITCRGCASELEYTESDVQERYGKDYSGGPDGCEYIVCPSCSKQVIIRSW